MKYKILWEESIKAINRYQAIIDSDNLPTKKDIENIVKNHKYNNKKIVSEFQLGNAQFLCSLRSEETT